MGIVGKGNACCGFRRIGDRQAVVLVGKGKGRVWV